MMARGQRKTNNCRGKRETVYCKRETNCKTQCQRNRRGPHEIKMTTSTQPPQDPDDART